MINSKLAIKAINAKLDSMSHDEAVAYLKTMGFSFKEENLPIQEFPSVTPNMKNVYKVYSQIGLKPSFQKKRVIAEINTKCKVKK